MTSTRAWVIAAASVTFCACGAVPTNGPKLAVGSGVPRHALPPGCGPAGAMFTCNPLTNAGCDVSKREACDQDDDGGFECNEPPNYVKEGGDCDAADGPSCLPGMGCAGATDDDPSGKCAKFCCSDADCRDAKRCKANAQKFGSFGFCR